MKKVDEITGQIIGAAMRVHKELGPGLLESAYEVCLAFELTQVGLRFERQAAMPLRYKDVFLDCGYRIDLFIERCVVVELKAVERLERIHEAQLLSYLKLSHCWAGLLINFNVPILKNGMRRLVNGSAPGIDFSVPSVCSVVLPGVSAAEANQRCDES